jgi:hypothetical protein
MSSRRRPKHPKPDANHRIVADFAAIGHYRGYKVAAVDVSSLAATGFDWLLAVGAVNVCIEIKTPEAYASKDHGLTRGEQDFFATWPGRKAIICSYKMLANLADDIIDELESTV